MATQSFYCLICKKNTLHDKISLAEHDAIRNLGKSGFVIVNGKEYGTMPKWLRRSLNVACDKSGILKVGEALTDFNGFWKCRECLKSNARKKNGEIDWDNN